jgi:hypothetical protein
MDVGDGDEDGTDGQGVDLVTDEGDVSGAAEAIGGAAQRAASRSV